jgi:hypothetical protein
MANFDTVAFGLWLVSSGKEDEYNASGATDRDAMQSWYTKNVASVIVIPGEDVLVGEDIVDLDETIPVTPNTLQGLIDSGAVEIKNLTECEVTCKSCGASYVAKVSLTGHE